MDRYLDFNNYVSVLASENFYIALEFAEGDYLVALEGLPSFTLVVLNWRTKERVASIDTDLHCANQTLT